MIVSCFVSYKEYYILLVVLVVVILSQLYVTFSMMINHYDIMTLHLHLCYAKNAMSMCIL